MRLIFSKNLIVLTCFTPILVGCSALNKLKPSKPEYINFEIFAATTLNPNLQNIPSPMRIDIYELKEIGEFNAVTYKELMDNEKVLGEKLVNHTQYIIHPDSIKYIPFQVDNTAKYLGVAAGYLNINNTNWKVSLLKQPKISFNTHKNYLYIYADEIGLQQLSQSQMTVLLKEYAKRHPNDPIVKKNGKLVAPKPDYSKGIYTQKTF